MEKLPAKIHDDALPARVLTDAQEKFAVHFAAFGDPSAAYHHAYNVTTTRKASVQQMAYRLIRHPGIANRITALRNAAAAGDVMATRERLIADLEAMVDVDVASMVTLRVVPCAECWPDIAIAEAMGRGLKGEAPMPDLDAPNDGCAACAGAGRNVGHLTPTAELSLPARRLFKGLEFHDSGAVKRVLLHSQAALRIELHRLKGMHVDRSVNLTLNADLKPLKAGMTVEEALALMDSVETTDNVVSEQ
jgi:hypothetical protein